MIEKTLDQINKELNEKAKTIVYAKISDWAGNVLFETSNYWTALDKWFELSEDNDDVYLDSYTKNGDNLGIFY